LILTVCDKSVPGWSLPLNVVVVAKAEVLANSDAATNRFLNIIFPR